MSGVLYLVATPIGNLEDITLRAIKTLNESSIVLAENTKTSKKLFSSHGINSKLVSFNDFSSNTKIVSLLGKLKDGYSISLISDAGTPLISDPGFNLVSQAIDENIRIESIPGPSAVIAGLITSGIDNQKFIFEGFLPKKNNELKKTFSKLNYESRTTIFFESPHRIIKSLKVMEQILDSRRKISIARELTKMHETILRGTIGEVASFIEKDPNLTRGEIVLIFEGTNNNFSDFDEKLDELFNSLKKEVSLKKFSKVFSRITNFSAKEIYNKYKE